jgi:hypothetical protein
LTPDEIAYNKVKAAKKALIAGQPKPNDCPMDVWKALADVYEPSKKAVPQRS